jgi:hypothetical protein
MIKAQKERHRCRCDAALGVPETGARGAGGEPAAQQCERCAGDPQNPAGLSAPEHVNPRIQGRLIEPHIPVKRRPFQDAAGCGDSVRFIGPQNVAMAQANGRQQRETSEPKCHLSAVDASHACPSQDAK